MTYFCEVCGVFGEGQFCWICERREFLQWGRVWNRGVESHVATDVTDGAPGDEAWAGETRLSQGGCS